MGRAPCCINHKAQKRGPWTPEEDQKLIVYLQSHGLSNWRTLPKLAGLSRCGKSCRLRWTNYLRPDIKRGTFSIHEDLTIICLHAVLGNKWSAIASHIPGRTDNDIKNHWHSRLKKQLILMGIDPVTHGLLPMPDMDSFIASSSITGSSIAAGWNTALAESDLGRMSRDYMNSIADEDSWLRISQIGKLSAKIDNRVIGPPMSACPSSENSLLLPSISPDQLSLPDTSRWLHGFRKQIKRDFDCLKDSAENNAFVQEALQFSNLERTSEEMPNIIQSSEIPSNLINETYVFHNELPSEREIMYSDYKPFYWQGMPEILQNAIQYHSDGPFGSPVSTADITAARSDLLNKGNEILYWDNLLKLTENGRP